MVIFKKCLQLGCNVSFAEGRMEWVSFPAEVASQHRFQVVQIMGVSPTEIDQTAGVRARVAYGYRLVHPSLAKSYKELLESEDEGDLETLRRLERERTFVTIECEYAAFYQFSGDLKEFSPSPTLQAKISEDVWPFWVEFLVSQSRRMELPTHLLPDTPAFDADNFEEAMDLRNEDS